MGSLREFFRPVSSILKDGCLQSWQHFLFFLVHMLINDLVFVDFASLLINSTLVVEFQRDNVVFMELFSPPFRNFVLYFVLNLVLIRTPAQSLGYRKVMQLVELLIKV